MTREEVILHKKATALNAIRKIYNPHNLKSGKLMSNNSWDESWVEQRDYMVKQIIEQLEKELLELKQ
jgi:adenylate kinase